MSKVIVRKINSIYILIILIFISIICVHLLRENLEVPFALGEHTLLIFIPFFLYSIYELSIRKYKFSIVIFLIFIFISFIPIIPYLDNIIIHKKGDDSIIFIRSANFMLNNLTLTFSNNHTIYTHQPGISYFYALEILIFGKENRLLQLFNITLFFIIFYKYKDVLIERLKKKHLLILKILLILSVPYIIKNILYTYSEWLTVLLICFLPKLFYFKRNYFFYIILALIPFIRQNLIIASLFLFLFIEFQNYLFNKKINYRNIIIFFGFLFLPVYHNFYYANSFAFFNKNIPIIIENANSLNDYFSLKWLINNFVFLIDAVFFRLKEIFLISHYKIYDYKTMIENKIISIFILPMILYLLFIIKKNKFKSKKFFMILIFIFTFGPPTILGNQSFPRFEFVNIYFCLTAFYFINLKKKIN